MTDTENGLDRELTFTRFEKMCALYPENTAIVYLGQRFSYRRLKDLSERFDDVRGFSDTSESGSQTDRARALSQMPDSRLLLLGNLLPFG